MRKWYQWILPISCLIFPLISFIWYSDNILSKVFWFLIFIGGVKVFLDSVKENKIKGTQD